MHILFRQSIGRPPRIAIVEVRRFVATKVLGQGGQVPPACVHVRAQVLASPLFDGARFARHLEDAFWDMWRRHSNDIKNGN